MAEDLRNRDADAFDILTGVTVPFRFHNEDTDIRFRKIVIALNREEQVSEFCLNTNLADIVDLDRDAMSVFYRASRLPPSPRLLR